MSHPSLSHTLTRIVTGHTPFVYVYVLLIPLVNWSFANFPTVTTWDGGEWSAMSIVTGLVLVARDFAQREVGHYIFMPLMVGIAVSFAMAPPEIAAASALAFAVSECVDWLVYTVTKRPLSQRVMLSCIASAPVDTTIFLIGADMAIPGLFSWSTLICSIASKLFGGYVVYVTLKRRERRRHATA